MRRGETRPPPGTELPPMSIAMLTCSTLMQRGLLKMSQNSYNMGFEVNWDTHSSNTIYQQLLPFDAICRITSSSSPRMSPLQVSIPSSMAAAASMMRPWKTSRAFSAEGNKVKGVSPQKIPPFPWKKALYPQLGLFVRSPLLGRTPTFPPA